MSLVDILPGEISIRPLLAGDSLEHITDLLHRAYAVLARMGLRYMATDQSIEVTRMRAAEGACLVAVAGETIVGTILFRNGAQTKGCPWYDRAEVASLGQFAVEPNLQTKGLGRRLIGHVEELARRSGAREIALDTAEPARHLFDWYGRLGYRFVETTQWSHTNYRSVVMSKTL